MLNVTGATEPFDFERLIVIVMVISFTDCVAYASVDRRSDYEMCLSKCPQDAWTGDITDKECFVACNELCKGGKE